MPTSAPSSATWASSRRPASRKASPASSSGTARITASNPLPGREGLGVGTAEGGRNSESAKGLLRSPTHPRPLPCREGSSEGPALHSGQLAAAVEVLEVGEEAAGGRQAGERRVTQRAIGFVGDSGDDEIVASVERPAVERDAIFAARFVRIGQRVVDRYLVPVRFEA